MITQGEWDDLPQVIKTIYLRPDSIVRAYWALPTKIILTIETLGEVVWLRNANGVWNIEGDHK